jgi:hypothetical protein
MSGLASDIAGFEILARPANAEDFPEAWVQIAAGNQLLAALRDAVQWQKLGLVRKLLAEWKYFLARRSDDACMVEVLLACAEIAAGQDAFERLMTFAATTAAPAPRTGAFRGTMTPAEYWAGVLRPWIASVEWRASFSAAWLMDVLHLLTERNSSSERWNAARRVDSKTATLALLVRTGDKGAPRGVVATLLVEALAEGSGTVYPDPAKHAFLRADTEFTRSIAAAIDCVRREGLWAAPSHDLRWSLSRDDGAEIVDVAGPSAGLAFGLCFAQAIACIPSPLSGVAVNEHRVSDVDIARLDLRGVAASAILGQDGRLSPVGYGIEKVVSAAKDARFPKSHTVVVAVEQDLDLSSAMTRDPETGTWREPAGNFVVESAASFGEALEKVNAERWKRVDSGQLLAAGPFLRVRFVYAAVTVAAAGMTVALLAANRFVHHAQAGPKIEAANENITPMRPAISAPQAFGAAPVASPAVHQAQDRIVFVRRDVVAPEAPKQETARAEPQSPVSSIAPVPPPGSQQPVVAKGPLLEQLRALQLRRDAIVPVLDSLRDRQRTAYGFSLGTHLARPELRMMEQLSSAEAEIAKQEMDHEVVLSSLQAARAAIEALESLLNIRNGGQP